MSNLEVKKIRKSMRLSQTEFGKMLGVSLRSVQTWESGEREMSETASILLNKIIADKRKSNLNEFTTSEIMLYLSDNIDKFENDPIYKLFINNKIKDGVIKMLEEKREEIDNVMKKKNLK